MNLTEKGLKGEIQKLDIIDAHTHLGKWTSVTIREHNEDHIVSYMDYIGINKSVLSSSISICSDFKAGNDHVLSAIEKYPDRLLGYVTVNPNYKDGLLEEYKRFEHCKNIVGIKIHPSYNGKSVTAPEFEELYEYANEKECMILVHTFSNSDVNLLAQVMKKYSKANFIFAHAGARTGVELTAELIKNYENAYCDIPVASAIANVVELLVHNGSSDKILFGTDSPLADYRISYGRVLFSNISDDDKLKIFGGNFRRLLSKTKF